MATNKSYTVEWSFTFLCCPVPSQITYKLREGEHLGILISVQITCKAPYSKQTLGWLLQFKSQPDRPQVLNHKTGFPPVPVLTSMCVRTVSSVPKLIMDSRYSS